MATPNFCNRCGARLTPGATFCAACGTPTSGVPASAPAPAYYRVAYPAVPTRGLLTPEEETSALTNVMWAAVLTIVGVLLGASADIVLFSTGGYPAGGTLILSPSYYALLGVGSLFEVIQAVLFYRGFSILGTRDSEFSVPAKLALLYAVTVGFTSLLSLLLLEELLAAQNCLNTTPSSMAINCFPPGLLGLETVVLILAVVALVGLIGLLIGIWRLGTRYSDDKFKVGAILLLFPFLNFVGAVLILLGSREAMRRRSRPSVAAVGFPPPSR